MLVVLRIVGDVVRVRVLIRRIRVLEVDRGLVGVMVLHLRIRSPRSLASRTVDRRRSCKTR